MDSDGEIHGELRHPDDLFKDDNLKTLEMIPVTDEHPSEFINSENISKYQIGYTGQKYHVQDNKIITSIKITDKDVIEKIQDGKVGLSLGYTVDLKKEEGLFDNQDYQF